MSRKSFKLNWRFLSFQMRWMWYAFPVSHASRAPQRRIRTLEWLWRLPAAALLSAKPKRRIRLFWLGSFYQWRWKRRSGKTFVSKKRANCFKEKKFLLKENEKRKEKWKKILKFNLAAKEEKYLNGRPIKECIKCNQRFLFTLKNCFTGNELGRSFMKI